MEKLTETKKILFKIGMPPHLDGYRYLKVAIPMVCGDETYLKRMTTGLYPEIAEMFDTEWWNVERSIRAAIEIVFNKGNSAELYEMFGNTIDAKKSKPTNSQFIATIVEYLK
ncbi:MAG: sporulation protein [Erysipelotrichaceae bacterium]|jgi:two-component system response regulator (stage 0 sporulation protein A)|nr:sporulation protein [Erysipelotrichaceae bacterium]